MKLRHLPRQLVDVRLGRRELGVDVATNAGSLRLPRCGTGARYGRSVSASSRSAGAILAASRSAAERETSRFRQTTVEPEVERARAMASSPVKQWNTPRTSPPLPRGGCRTCRRSPRGCESTTGSRSSRAVATCARKISLLDSPRREVVVVVQADLTDRARPLVSHALAHRHHRTARRRRQNPPHGADGCRSRTASPATRSSRRARMDSSAVAGAEDARAPGRAPRPRARATTASRSVDEFLAGEVAVGVDHDAET